MCVCVRVWCVRAHLQASTGGVGGAEEVERCVQEVNSLLGVSSSVGGMFSPRLCSVLLFCQSALLSLTANSLASTSSWPRSSCIIHES